MRNLTPDFDFDFDSLDRKFLKLRESLRINVDSGELRDDVSAEFSINKLNPGIRDGESRILSVDSSFLCRELKFFALWAIHTVSFFGIFDGDMHNDPLTGGRRVGYKEMGYNSVLDIGRFERHDGIERNLNILRIGHEYKSLLDSWKELNAGVDYLLLDGSIYTVLKRIKDNETLMALYNELKDSGRFVGMVEDSASVGIARGLGKDMTNIALFDMVLDENEFIVQEREGINIIYLKLPSKKLSYTHSRKSNPLTVRWEFSYPEFVHDLENLVAIWSREDDLLHPQLYPLRIADYLTRRVKVGGILERFVRENELEPRHRERREG